MNYTTGELYMSVVNTALVGALAAAYLLGGLAAAEQTGSAAAYCRQEAVDYGIEPELVAEYVAGCIEAMGGAAAMAPDEAGVDEGAMSPEVQTSRESE
jgi:hypothetical protein